jgi:hypothetical protein
MQTINVPEILHALTMFFTQPVVLTNLALLGPAVLLGLQVYFRAFGKQPARNVEAAFDTDRELSSAWRDIEREYAELFDTYRRGRSVHSFRVNRKSDWRFDQRRHAAADANRDVDALLARFHQAQRIARWRFAVWKWHVAGARAADAGTLTYLAALLILLVTIGNAAFAISGAAALAVTAAVWLGHAMLLTPGEQRRIVSTDIGWEALAQAYEASEDGAEA